MLVKIFLQIPSHAALLLSTHRVPIALKNEKRKQGLLCSTAITFLFYL